MRKENHDPTALRWHPCRVLAPAFLATAVLATALGGQERIPTDRSLTASLLAGAMPSPSGPVWMDRGFADTAQSGTRLDMVWGSATGGINGGRRATVVLGVRSETMQRL